MGAGYEFGSGTTLYAHYREGKGTYKDPTPGAATGDFTEHETDVQLTWPITAKTAVDARIGNLSRSNDVSKQNDFSGMVGSAAVRWDITGKTRLVAGYNRRPERQRLRLRRPCPERPLLPRADLEGDGAGRVERALRARQPRLEERAGRPRP